LERKIFSMLKKHHEYIHFTSQHGINLLATLLEYVKLNVYFVCVCEGVYVRACVRVCVSTCVFVWSTALVYISKMTEQSFSNYLILFTWYLKVKYLPTVCNCVCVCVSCVSFFVTVVSDCSRHFMESYHLSNKMMGLRRTWLAPYRQLVRCVHVDFDHCTDHCGGWPLG